MNLKMFNNVDIDRVFDALHSGVFQSIQPKIIEKNTFFKLQKKLQDTFQRCLVFAFFFFSDSSQKNMTGTKLVVQTMPFIIKNKFTLQDVPKKISMPGDFSNHFFIVGYMNLCLRTFWYTWHLKIKCTCTFCLKQVECTVHCILDFYQKPCLHIRVYRD